MPSNAKAPCPCPKCNGKQRLVETVRKHREIQVRARQQGTGVNIPTTSSRTQSMPTDPNDSSGDDSDSARSSSSDLSSNDSSTQSARDRLTGDLDTVQVGLDRPRPPSAGSPAGSPGRPAKRPRVGDFQFEEQGTGVGSDDPSLEYVDEDYSDRGGGAGGGEEMDTRMDDSSLGHIEEDYHHDGVRGAGDSDRAGDDREASHQEDDTGSNRNGSQSPDAPVMHEEDGESGNGDDGSNHSSAQYRETQQIEDEVDSGESDNEDDDVRLAAQQRELEVQLELALQAAREHMHNPGDRDPTLHDDEEEDPFLSRISHVLNSQELINLIRGASLDNDKLPLDTIHRLRNPLQPLPTGDFLTKDERTCLQLYVSQSPYPQQSYKSALEVFVDNSDMTKPLSYYRVEKLMTRITGVVPIYDDMCINGCMAFVGSHSDDEVCEDCGEPHYNTTALQLKNKKIPRQRSCTIPLGPQVQPLRASLEGAQAMGYRQRKTEDLLNGTLPDDVFDDIFCGDDLLDLHQRLGLTEDDTTVGFSLDGAQLYQNKKSDTWIGIWVVYDYDPQIRYKHRHVLPAVIIPGPKKPKRLDTFMFRSFYHLSALQRENGGRGIPVYNRAKDAIVNSRIIFLTGTADAKGLVELDGRVGHHGAKGCRVGCDFKGRHKGTGHYYTAHLRPNNYNVDGCMHGDFDFSQAPTRPTVEQYQADLNKVIQSPDQATYETNRKETGISKPTIISGLHPKAVLTPPLCFSLDTMHHFYLNLTEFFASLFRGTLRAEGEDSKRDWPWNKLSGQAWKDHGAFVRKALKYIPTSFERPPRDPTEKMNSGWTAFEWYHWFYNLGPGLFRQFLPHDLWRHYCRLVRCVRLLNNRVIAAKDIHEAQEHANTFVRDFELLYYQRNPDRLHFCRPSIHTLLHAPSEVTRTGPGAYHNQLVMERTIGLLGKEVRQPGTPFANLCTVAVRKCRLNAVKKMYPHFDKTTENKIPMYATDLGNGYLFLPIDDKDPKVVKGVLGDYLEQELGYKKVRRWGNMRLPNGERVRSSFSEDRKISEDKRCTRMAKITLNDRTEYGEVQFFFRKRIVGGLEPCALVRLFSRPDQELWEQSHQTLWACSLPPIDEALKIIPITAITASVSMQPLPPLEGEPDGRWFPMEKNILEDTVLPDEDEIQPD